MTNLQCLGSGLAPAAWTSPTEGRCRECGEEVAVTMGRCVVHWSWAWGDFGITLCLDGDKDRR